jgi:hypothetical protein
MYSLGPWQIIQNKFTKMVFIHIGCPEGYPVSYPVFTECGGPKQNKRDWDNAILMNSAPELLEACKAALESIKAAMTEEEHLDMPPQIVDKLECIIAKAEGR